MKVSARVVGKVDLDKFQRLVFNKEEVVGGDFSGRSLDWLTVVESRFERCRFERMRVERASFGAGMTQSEFVECSFDGSRILSLASGFSRFVRCTFRDVDICDWGGEYLDLVDCVFSGRLKSAIFWGR